MSIRTISSVICFVFFNLFFATSLSAHGTSEPVFISVSNQGFEPQTLTIEPHTRVVFVNIGEDEHWPASDRHPSHTDYAGTDLETHCSEDYIGNEPFDSCGGIKPNETWSFTFEKTGTFEYHDHIWSHLGGTIVVANSEEPSLWKKFMLWLSGLFSAAEPEPESSNKDTEISVFQDNLQRLEDTVIHITISEDPRAAINYLELIGKTDEIASRYCHDMLHEIGRAAFENEGGVEQALKYNSDYCNSGYIHGVFEAFFETPESVDADLTGLCQAVSGNRWFDVWQCYHGIGHGFMYQTGGDLDESLTLCQTLEETFMQNQCANGVYMEVFNNEILAKEPSFVSASNPFATCDVREFEQNDCYLYAPTYYTQVLDEDYKEVFQYCENLEPNVRSTCIVGAASEAGKRNQHNLASAYTNCEQYSEQEDINLCVRGIAGITVFQTASIDSALQSCDTTESYSSLCRTYVNNLTPLFDPM